MCVCVCEQSVGLHLLSDGPASVPHSQVVEEVLRGFKGLLLVVSHDRAFMDNVSDQLLVLKGDGGVRLFDGCYSEVGNFMFLLELAARVSVMGMNESLVQAETYLFEQVVNNLGFTTHALELCCAVVCAVDFLKCDVQHREMRSAPLSPPVSAGSSFLPLCCKRLLRTYVACVTCDVCPVDCMV